METLALPPPWSPLHQYPRRWNPVRWPPRTPAGHQSSQSPCGTCDTIGCVPARCRSQTKSRCRSLARTWHSAPACHRIGSRGGERAAGLRTRCHRRATCGTSRRSNLWRRYLRRGEGRRTKPRVWVGKKVVEQEVGVPVSSDSEIHRGLEEPHLTRRMGGCPSYCQLPAGSGGVAGGGQVTLAGCPGSAGGHGGVVAAVGTDQNREGATEEA